MDNPFIKKHGFEAPPIAILEGRTIGFGRNGAMAQYKCMACGCEISVKLKGDMTQENLDSWGKMKATKHHQCPVVANIMETDKKKIFADIYRGADKKNDQDYKAEKRGYGKSTGRA